MESPKSQNTLQETKRTTYTVRCSKCGYRNPPNHEFCGSCGKALSQRSPIVTSKSLEDKADNLSQPPNRPEKQSVASGRRSHFLLWGCVGGGILIIGVTVLTAVVFGVVSLKLGPLIAPTPTPQGLAGFLIGAWEWQGEDGRFSIMEFAPDGSFVSSDESYTYEVVSEYTILIHKVGYGESALRVEDFQGDTITIGEPGETVRTYHRLPSVPNLAEAIIGFWVYKGENDKFAMEFTTNGTVIAYDFGIGKYKILSNNTVEIYDTDYQQEHPEQKYFIRFIRASHDTLTLHLDPNTTYDLTRVEEIPDLAKNIVGLWQVEPGFLTEFTADGHFIGHNPDGGVGEYEVISNNTILLKGNGEITPLNIINLSKDSLSLGSWGEVYTEGDKPDIWTRVNP